jgi:hypothetical protein
LFRSDAIIVPTERRQPVPLIERQHRVRHLVKRLLHRLRRVSGTNASISQSDAAPSRRQRKGRVSERAILGAAISGMLLFAERRLLNRM